MLVDLDLRDERVIVFGRGEEVELRAKQFLEAGARVLVVAKEVTRRLRLSAGETLQLARYEGIDRSVKLIRANRPHTVAIANEREGVARKLAEAARSCGAMVYVVDAPAMNDFNMPAVAKIGDVRVAISTGGLSPAMASVLRRRIERVIKPEDVLQVKLQGYARSVIRRHECDAESRREMIYRIIRSRRINALLREGELERAKEVAVKRVLASARRSGSSLG